MIDLEHIAGLPLKFDKANNSLIFEDDLERVIPSVRKLNEMITLLKDRKASALPDEFYFMYRDIHHPKHRDILRKNNIRYDITVIPSYLLGNEYNKTAGHYHPQKEESDLSYPEVYEVLLGEATYLLQKSTPPYNTVEEVIIVKARVGDKVIIPPNYGHITVNTGSETLVMANYMADGISSIYKPYEERGGGAYFILKENGEIKLVPNKTYPNLPSPLMIEAPETEFFDKRPMYIQVVENVEKYRFLNEPSIIKDYKFRRLTC